MAGCRTAERTHAEAEAFQRLAERHLDAAYRLAWAILRDPTEAQDATHDAFIHAWRKWPSLRDPDRLEAWFDRILVNACRNRLRRSSRWPITDISTEIIEAADQPGEPDQRDVVEDALAQLSPDHRVIVALRFYRDLPIGEIAARLAIPVGTVHSRLHYALRRMPDVIAAADREGTER